MAKKITYKASGVDIHKADIFIKKIAPMVKRTRSAAVLERHAAFASLFSLAGRSLNDPVLVSSTDGVGTKLMVAQLVGKHDTVGIDLVAMNVNDVLCAGAQPLFFLDYIACGKLDPRVLTEVMKGITEGCRQAGCSLIGGETAEMPGIYQKDDYDLAGFTVGIVDKNKIVDGSRISPGDVVIGLESNGLHSNGYSLVRKAFSLSEQKKFSTELLRPTRIYVKPVLKVLERFPVKGMAHVTGGAFYAKVAKIVPSGKCLCIDRASWPVPKIFGLVQARAHISDKEMFTTFNMGIGFVLVVAPKFAPAVIRAFQAQGVRAWQIGTVVNDKRQRIIL